MTEPTYREKFDFILEHIANGDDDLVDDLRQYLMHCRKFGKDAANNKYPNCKNIKFTNKELKLAWNKILKTLEKIGEKK